MRKLNKYSNSKQSHWRSLNVNFLSKNLLFLRNWSYQTDLTKLILPNWSYQTLVWMLIQLTQLLYLFSLFLTLCTIALEIVVVLFLKMFNSSCYKYLLSMTPLQENKRLEFNKSPNFVILCIIESFNITGYKNIKIMLFYRMLVITIYTVFHQAVSQRCTSWYD